MNVRRVGGFVMGNVVPAEPYGVKMVAELTKDRGTNEAGQTLDPLCARETLEYFNMELEDAVAVEGVWAEMHQGLYELGVAAVEVSQAE